MYIKKSTKYVNKKGANEIMHLAILVTNTDDSEFSKRHPRDSEKFADLIHLARPGWRCTAFWVRDGEFPEDIGAFDGAMITGSPASVRSGAPWIAQLMDLIRDMHARRIPLFGACFGHQAIALALGGALDHNPDGWVHGLTRNQLIARPGWAAELPDEVKLYGSHCECVAHLPDGAEPLMQSGPIMTGYTVGSHIITTQHHPEMSHGFITALTEEMRETLSDTEYATACTSLEDHADQAAFAEALARFFEQAAG